MNKPTFEDIVSDLGRFIRRTLAQLGVASRDLGDVEQEVLRGIHRGLPAFDPALSANPENALRGWVFAICERQAANHRRTMMRRGELLFGNDELDTSPGDAVDPEAQLIAAELKAWLGAVLDKLEPCRRDVLVAYELQGGEMIDIAAHLGIPVNTAWNRLRLARNDIREAWRRWTGDKPPPRHRKLREARGAIAHEHEAETQANERAQEADPATKLPASRPSMTARLCNVLASVDANVERLARNTGQRS